MTDTMLIGSNKQPSNFIRPNGEELTLGDIVREAQMRSHLSVKRWNKQASNRTELHERLIACVVRDWELEAA